jgi:hypothetical protein
MRTSSPFVKTGNSGSTGSTQHRSAPPTPGSRSSEPTKRVRPHFCCEPLGAWESLWLIWPEKHRGDNPLDSHKAFFESVSSGQSARSVSSCEVFVGSVIKKRRKRMAKKKHRKLLRKTRHQRRNKK